MNGDGWPILANNLQSAHDNLHNTSVFHTTGYIATCHSLAEQLVRDHSETGDLPDERLLADARKVCAFCADAAGLLNADRASHLTFLSRLEELPYFCDQADERRAELLTCRDEQLAA